MTKFFATLKLVWELWPKLYALANSVGGYIHIQKENRKEGKLSTIFQEQRDGVETDTKEDTAARASRLDDLFK